MGCLEGSELYPIRQVDDLGVATRILDQLAQKLLQAYAVGEHDSGIGHGRHVSRRRLEGVRVHADGQQRRQLDSICGDLLDDVRHDAGRSDGLQLHYPLGRHRLCLGLLRLGCGDLRRRRTGARQPDDAQQAERHAVIPDKRDRGMPYLHQRNLPRRCDSAGMLSAEACGTGWRGASANPATSPTNHFHAILRDAMRNGRSSTVPPVRAGVLLPRTRWSDRLA